MSIELIAALAVFALVSSITPGPNNLMLMASGANFGFQRTIPHMLGVALGFTFMVVMVGIGLMQLFDMFPLTYTILKVLSVAYLVYLAYRIATAAPPSADEQARGKPFTFIQAVLFQWVNPKAWTMALTAIAVYSPSRELSAVVWVALIFGVINLPSVSVWTVLGQQLRKWLTSHRRLQVFNFSMGALLLGSLYPVLLT